MPLNSAELRSKIAILEEKFFLAPFLATKEALAPLASDLNISGRLIRSFRHLVCQNLSISSDYIDIDT